MGFKTRCHALFFLYISLGKSSHILYTKPTLRNGVMTMKIIVIGTSHAGIAFALRAREEYPDAQITMYEREEGISFISQSIPLYLMGKSDILKHGNYTSVDDLKKLNIDVKVNCVVEKIDFKKKEISYVLFNTTDLLTDSYDKLVMATGSYPSLPLFSGDSDHVHVIKNVSDAKNLRDIIKKENQVIVLGAGLIGVEIARILALRNVKVKLIHPHEHILNKYVDKELADSFQKDLEDIGVEVYLNTVATDLAVNDKNKKITVYTDNHQQYLADDVIVSIGFRPNSLLVRNDAQLGDMGAIVVDEYMHTSIKDVLAVGDCATSVVNGVSHPIYMPHASEAIRQGQIAALNLSKKVRAIPPSQNTYNMNLEGLTICTTGLTLKNALANGIDAKQIFYRNDALDEDHYLEMWFVYENKTHRIIGAQIKSSVTSANEYVNILSLAISQKLTIEDLEFSDFFFEHGYKNPETFTSILAKLIRESERK